MPTILVAAGAGISAAAGGIAEIGQRVSDAEIWDQMQTPAYWAAGVLAVGAGALLGRDTSLPGRPRRSRRS